ncbi:MAG TPA: DNA primase [Gemmatimonadaceae bacterium]|nr:DNA primase [Gemmatimonadaceae bacterium]
MTREEVKERVREAADIVQIIGESVPLKRQGNTYRGPCPFHNGKDRNFTIWPKTGYYKCFVCHEQGDVFSFLQKRLGMDFPTALKSVAEKSGIEIPRSDPRGASAPDPREAAWETLATASAHFTSVLWSDPAAESARAYLASRGIDRATAEQFGLGYAADGERVLSHLRNLGFDDARLTEVGLRTAGDDERKPGPRFWHRLMIPIHDAAGHIVGFGGRTLGSAKPKYLNSPDSPIFSKSKLLYGFHAAKLAMRREAKAILVEGYFDLIRVAAAGIDYAVASMGTALTEPQAQLLTRYTRQVMIAYDSDPPGLRATFRSADALLEHGVRVRVVTLPAGEDPDSYIAKHSRADFEALLGQALDVFDRKVQLAERGGWFADLSKKRRAIDKLLPTIRVTADPITQQLYVGRLAEASGVSPDVLWREIGGTPVEPVVTPAPRPASREAKASPRRQLAKVAGLKTERWLVQYLLAARSLIEEFASRLDDSMFRDPASRAIYRALRAGRPDATLAELTKDLSPDEIALVQEMQQEGTMGANPAVAVEACLAKLEERDLKEQRREIDQKMKFASEAEKTELTKEKMTRLWRRGAP